MWIAQREKPIRTLLSQMAIELGRHLKRTCESVFSEIWWKRKDRTASDSARGTPTMRRVKPIEKWLVSFCHWADGEDMRTRVHIHALPASHRVNPYDGMNL